MFVTFFFIFLELINGFKFLCFYTQECDKLGSLFFDGICFSINLYFTRVAWSFYIRLERSHELLIIHGKYLEKMINDESYKLNDIKLHVYPERPMIINNVEVNEKEMTLYKTLNVN